MMRRTPLTRKSPMPGHKADLKSGATKLRARKCSVAGCKLPAKTFTALKGWCSPEHGAIVAEQLLVRRKAAAAKTERQVDRARKEALLTIPELKKLAQTAFNAFIRERDKDRPCICCGRFKVEHSLTGSVWDAGHYRSTGSADHLRFDEDNCHRQLVKCNQWGAGRAVDYRIGLINRIGLERVEALEADNAVVKWTREGLIATRKTYQAKLKQMKESAK
jgi:hypothetical protein